MARIEGDGQLKQQDLADQIPVAVSGQLPLGDGDRFQCIKKPV
jgi:hypothetical protein